MAQDTDNTKSVDASYHFAVRAINDAIEGHTATAQLMIVASLRGHLNQCAKDARARQRNI